MNLVASCKNPNKPKVFFLFRCDFKQKGGGDVNLLKEFAAAMSDSWDVQMGVSLTEMADWMPDLVVAANLDRPVEAARALRWCKDRNIRFALYTLHHPYQGITKYLQNGVGGARKVLASLSRSKPQSYEQLLWSTRFIMGVLGRVPKVPMGLVRKCQKQLITNSDALLVTCSEELAEIERDIGAVQCKVYTIPHILADSDINIPIESKDSLSRYKGAILCPGRIETRKNQALVLNLAKKYPEYCFLFVGKGSPTEQRYVEEFITAASTLSNVELLDQVPLPQLEYLISIAKVVVSASWFEVTSLIELSVARHNIPLVASKFSYLNHFYPSGEYFDPTSYEDLEKKFNDALYLGECKTSTRFQYPSRPDIVSHFDEVVKV